MKANYTILLFLMLIACQLTSAQNTDNQYIELINAQDYLTLSRRYETGKDSLQSEVTKLMTEAFTKAALNKSNESNEAVGILLNSHQEELGLNGITALIVLMTDNMKRLGNYKESADVLQSFLDQTASFNGLDSLTRKGLEKLTYWGALGNGVIPEIIRPKRDCEISFFYGKDKFRNHAYINAELNGKTVSFILDTGADAYDTNTVTEGFARKNGIRIMKDSVVINGTAEGYAKLGFADSMKIGDIVYKNVSFTVTPGDNLLPVDSIFLDAILGSVFLKAMKEIQIFPNEKKVVFPYEESELPSGGANMTLIGGQPYVEAFSSGERLLLHFDTGGGIGLSSKYYMKHKDQIEAIGKLDSTGGVGGFGAMKRMNKYILPSFSLQVGSEKREIKDMVVLADIDFSHRVGDGAIGFDFVQLFNKTTINYNKMFLKFE
ncbi:MAG: retropepsin-like aspartic protease [Dysgonomonas sp.]